MNKNSLMKAAMPVPYIIALVFGVIIIAVLGYWLYTQSSKSGSKGAIGECDAKKLLFCQAYKSLGYTTEPLIDFPVGCNKPTADRCIELLGGCKGKPTSYTEDSCKSAGGEWIKR